MTWSQREAVESRGFKTRRRQVQGRGEKAAVSAVPSTPAIFTQERWTAEGLAKNTNTPGPKYWLPREVGGPVRVGYRS